MSDIVRWLDSATCLRPLQTTDGSQLFEVVERDREHLGEFLVWVKTVNTLEDAQAIIHRALECRAAGTDIRFGIFNEGKLMGIISLHFMAPGYSAEFSIWLAQTAVGKNLANRASKEIFEYARELGLRRIQFRLRATNERSRAFITRLGLTYEGNEQFGEYDNGWQVVERYALYI